MESLTSITVGGAATGVAVGALTAVATRNASTSLMVGGAAALAGGFATDQLHQVADRHDVRGISLAAKPSVSLGVASGALAVGTLGWVLTGATSYGSGVQRVATAAAGAVVGGALALSALNGLDVE